jgi:DNA-binding XRE family transcriptional regulator
LVAGPPTGTVAGMANDEESKLGGYRLSEIVRRVRRTADFSQRELARWAKVSPACIGATEAGRSAPSLAVLQRILNAANYRPSEWPPHWRRPGRLQPDTDSA